MSELTGKKFGPVGAPRWQTVLLFSDVPIVLLFLWLVEFHFFIHLFLL